ncbi:hypothetical protein D9M68_1005680 [compost metagenome]
MSEMVVIADNNGMRFEGIVEEIDYIILCTHHRKIAGERNDDNMIDTLGCNTGYLLFQRR